MTNRTTVQGLLGAAFALLAVAMPAQAQNLDSRLLPYVGCWEAVGAEQEVGLLCFRPSGNGLELSNYANGEVVSSERMVADGARREVTADGCEGWETVDFSADGRRAFTTTEFTCASGEARTGTGIMAVLAPNRWADVRALDVDGEKVAWVQEYQLATLERMAEEGVTDPSQGQLGQIRARRVAASSVITLDDVQEAIGRVDAKAVETWIVVQRDILEPTSDDLIALADAGVPDEVIDAVVAVSHPDRFMAATSAPIEEYEVEGRRPMRYRGYMAFDPFWGPPLGYGAGYRYGYGYSPFGYSGYDYGYGYGYGYYGARPGVVIIDRQRNSGGRVYNGRGYRRGDNGSAGGSAQPRTGGSGPEYSRGNGSGSSGSAGSSSGSEPPPKPAPRRAVRRRGGGS